VIGHVGASEDLVDEAATARTQNTAELVARRLKVGVHQRFLRPDQVGRAVIERKSLGGSERERDLFGDGRLVRTLSSEIHMSLHRVDTGDRDAKPLREFDRVTALATPDVHERRSRDRFEACEQIPQAAGPARVEGLIEATLGRFFDAGVGVVRLLDRDFVSTPPFCRTSARVALNGSVRRIAGWFPWLSA